MSLTVTGYPSPVVSGTAHSFTVTALDQYGNTATGYSGIVHFTSNDPQGALLPGDSSLTNGFGTFSVTLKTVGTRTNSAGRSSLRELVMGPPSRSDGCASWYL